jgi:hypothetical protein
LCEDGSFDSPSSSNLAFGLFPTYGVGEGDADSEADGDASASAFFLVAAFFGEADASGDASVVAALFLAVVVFFAVVFFAVPSCVVVAVLEVEAVSCFCAQEVTNAMPIKAVIKDKTDFFIGCC